MYTWLASKRELLTEGSVSSETEEKLRRVTYGAGGWSLLGPNVQIIAGAYELFNHWEAPFILLGILMVVALQAGVFLAREESDD